MATESQHTEQKQRCLVCGKSQSKALRRGLCDTDYFRFRRAVAGMQPEQQQAFEEALIADGKLLTAGKRKAEGDVFQEAKRKFLRQTHPSEDHAGPTPTILDVLLPGPAAEESQGEKRQGKIKKPAKKGG